MSVDLMVCSLRSVSDVMRLRVMFPVELSSGLAALTMACESGDLGSLSRVRLLLLDRPEPEEALHYSGLDQHSPADEWAGHIDELRARRPGSLVSTGIPM